jgi:hypothetical protein
MRWSTDSVGVGAWGAAGIHAGVMHPDHAALQAALARRISALAPVAAHLREAVVHPAVAPHDWSGPAARAYRDLESELRGRLRHAADAAESALHESRLAMSQLATLAQHPAGVLHG